MTREMRTCTGLTAGLVGTIVAANLTASAFGLLPVGFGLWVPAGTAFAGLTFVLRDVIHRSGGWRWVAVAIAMGTAVSVVVSLWSGSPALGLSATRVAVGSGVAFGLSELADWAVFARLRKRSVLAAMLVSNTIGSAVDTGLFLIVAGFGFTWPAFCGRVFVKALVVSPLAIAVLALVGRRSSGEQRAVPRQRQHADGA